MVKIILKKNKIGGLTLLDFKLTTKLWESNCGVDIIDIYINGIELS